MSGYFKKLYAPTDEVINASERFYSSPEKIVWHGKNIFHSSELFKCKTARIKMNYFQKHTLRMINDF